MKDDKISAFYVGYESFVSKDKTKTFYVIQALLQDFKENSVKSCIKSVFVDKDQFFTLIESLKPFDNITLVRSFNTDTDKVYYKLS